MKKIFIALSLVLLLASCGEVAETPGLGQDPVDNTGDTEAPVVVLNGDSSIIVEYGDTWTDPGATFTDNVDSSGNADVLGTVDLDTLGTYTLSYMKSDAAGNLSVAVTRTVEVVDTTAPVVTLNGDALITVEFGDTWTDLGASCVDNYDAGSIKYTLAPVDHSELGTYTYPYTCIDSSGNETTVNRTVEVVDTTAPVLDILGNINYTIGDGIPSVANFVTATDNYDGDVIDSLDFSFNIGDFLSPGSYALTLTISDSSGNTTSADITVEVVAATAAELGAAALSIMADLAAMFTATPDEILLSEIGEVNSVIANIDPLIGNGYMEDEEIIQSSVFNTVTAPEYIEIVNAYNGSLSTMQTYLSAILPLLANITEYEVEYTFSGFTFSMVKVNEVQYQISVTGTILSQPIAIEIVIDELTLTSEYMYSIEFSTSVATWHYEIVRGVLGIESIVEVKEFLGDSAGVVYVNGFFVDGDELSGFILKDELTITRRMYFEFNDTSKGIYYLNDDTGTEKYISLNADAELVFEYENYQPNIPLLGSEKVRWALDMFTGIDSIAFDDGFLSNTFTINGTTDVTDSDAFNIEAKNYVVYLYDDVNQVYNEETAGNWFLRIEGEFDGDFDSYFEFETFMTPVFTYDVEQHVLDLAANKDSISLFGTNVLEITKEEILTALGN